MLRQTIKYGNKTPSRTTGRLFGAILDTRKEILNHKSLDQFVFNYQNKVNENLIIEVPLRNIEVLDEPLDFYSALHVSSIFELF